jgi:hypothetical protein
VVGKGLVSAFYAAGLLKTFITYLSTVSLRGRSGPICLTISRSLSPGKATPSLTVFNYGPPKDLLLIAWQPMSAGNYGSQGTGRPLRIGLHPCSLLYTVYCPPSTGNYLGTYHIFTKLQILSCQKVIHSPALMVLRRLLVVVAREVSSNLTNQGLLNGISAVVWARTLKQSSWGSGPHSS